MHGKRGTWWDGYHALSSLGTAGHYEGDKWRKWPETKILSKVEMSLSLKSPGNYKGCDYENKKNVMEITEKTEWGLRSRQHAGLWLRGGQVKGARIGRGCGGGDICMPLHCEQGGQEGKKWQHRVQFFSLQSRSGPAREARLTDDSQHLCYAAVTDEGLHVATSPFSVCLRDPPTLLPPPLTSGTARRMTDLPWKLPWNGL